MRRVRACTRLNLRLLLPCVLLLCICYVVVIMSAANGWMRLCPQQFRHPDHLNVSYSPFTPVTGTKTIIINAFREFDNQEILILAIVKMAEKTQHFCVLICRDHQTIVSPARQKHHATHFFFPSGTGDFTCQVPVGCEPRYAGLLAENINLNNLSVVPIINTISRRPGFPLRFTVCMSALFRRYNNVLQFIQAMELYRLLGAEHIIVYKTSCSPTMEKVLHYYSKKVGILEVLPWPIDAYINVSSNWFKTKPEEQLHYYGQIPALNDCIHRYMHKTKYLLIHDPDEVVVPKESDTWAEMVSTLETEHGDNVNFYFENNVFPIEVTEDRRSYHLPEWAHIPGINMLLHVKQEPIPEPHYNTGKMIVNPRTVLQLSVHSIYEHRQGTRTVKIGPELGKLYHIRRLKNTKINETQLIRDEGLLRFAPQLIAETNRALCDMELL